jgi:sodium-coupled monocarboxylate transporter 8/12
MTGFHPVDYIILAGYLAGVTLLGARFATRQHDAKDFFLAGRSMGWFPMVLSVIATDFSAISFLGAPGYVVAHDIVIDLQALTFIWVLPLSFYLFVRFFHRLELISAYEYLERRFSLPLRTSCSLLFICVRTGWMATALYATGLALAQATSVPFWACVAIIGVLTTVYSTLGGMRAVIWTDVAQFFVFTGAIAVVVVTAVRAVPSGFIGIWETASAEGHTRVLNFEGGFESITTPAVLIGGTFLVLISYGVDQVVIQRYLTAKDLRQIKRGMLFQVCATPLVLVSLVVIGLSVFSFYRHFPGRLPPGLEPDKWFPHFIVNELPVGVSGLVIAGLFAATMSSISSGVNSLTAACVIDFHRRFRAPHPEASRDEVDRREVWLSRILTVWWGLVATALAFVVGRIGVIAVISKALSGFFGGVLLGVFLLGILLRRANEQGSLLGAAIGFATVCAVGLGTPINLFWYAPIGCAATFASGAVLSLCFPSPAIHRLRGLTLIPPESEGA